jgi:hypothetical protein
MKPSRSFEAPTNLRPGRRRRRRWLLLPIVCLVLLAAGEAGLWFVAVSRAGTMLDAWMGHEAERGRVWTCPQRRFSGFPLQIAVECIGPTFAGTAGGHRVSGSLTALRADVAVYRPNHPVARLEGPVAVKLDDGRELTIEWASCAIILDATPFAIGRAGVEIERLVATVTSDTEDPTTITAARASVHASRLSPQSLDEPDLQIVASVADAAVPALDRMAGTSDPITGEALVSVTRGDLLADGSLDARLEAWRTHGGRLEIGRAFATKGTSHVDAEATLALDEQHRLQGDVNATISGVDTVMRRLGLPSQAATLGSLFAGLLGTQARASVPPPPNGASVALTLANGRVYLGPFRLPVALRPLY